MNEHSKVWSAQEAKAKFSELVRRAREQGPQTVTVHGRPAVTVQAVQASDYVEPKLTGKDFVAALRAGPKFDLELPRRPTGGSFRDADI